MSKKHENGYLSITGEDGNIEYAYTHSGSKVFFLSPEDQKRTVADLMAIMKKEESEGILRCTSCGTSMKKEKVAGYPLFAGINCEPCWEKHLAFAKKERQQGHICRMCRKPYSFCCC